MKILDTPQSGSMGLTVTYQSRYGQIRRQRTIPRNPRTPVQMEWRAAFQRGQERIVSLDGAMPGANGVAGCLLAGPQLLGNAQRRAVPGLGSRRSIAPQGCSKVGPGHSKPETRRPKEGEEGNIEHPTSNIQYLKGSRHRHWTFDVRCWMFDVEILQPSDFGLLSGFGLRSSDFRAAEQDLPSTDRTLEQP